jgi:hypothetical protein
MIKPLVVSKRFIEVSICKGFGLHHVHYVAC